MARIIVASYLIRLPVGGYMSWMLQWLLGFSRLGHDVYFVEKSGWPGSCIDPTNWTSSDDCSLGVQRVGEFLERFGLGNRWCYVDRTGTHFGLSRQRLEKVFATADLFVDHLRGWEWREEAEAVPLRVMVDGEPGFAQMRMAQELAAGNPPGEYEQYYSVGLNLADSPGIIPTLGKQWRPIFDPVITELFEVLPSDPSAPFTTVMSWTAHQPIEYAGEVFGQKDREFDKFKEIPARTNSRFELAIAGEGIPRRELAGLGWSLREAAEVTRSFDSWRSYISNSRGEFSICKNVFVATDCGFFSDRSAVYLACGRPVIMQETGFSRHLPCGRGLFAVRNLEEAVAAVEEIEANYEAHSRWAREIAAEYLHADKVLGRFLNELGLQEKG